MHITEEEYEQLPEEYQEQFKEMENKHPTVKPLDLLRDYLVKLATPPGGKILDPFVGSGTTGIAVQQINGKHPEQEDIEFIGIDKEAKWATLARERLDRLRRRDWEKYFALEEWQQAEGVGPKTAKDLYTHLGRVEEANLARLEEVRGIGEKTAKKIKNSLVG